MKYVSTRSGCSNLEFEDVLLTGLSRDGGLYVPHSWPHFSINDIRNLSGLNYIELATTIMLPFIGNSIPESVFREIVEHSYAEFNHPEIAPIKQIGNNQWITELFHGPTLAFKDYPLQIEYKVTDKLHLMTLLAPRVSND